MGGLKTGASLLADVMGGSPPSVEVAPIPTPAVESPQIEREAIVTPPERRPAKATKRERAPVVEQRPQHVVTTIRIRADQAHALRLAALELTAARGGGKPDASEVLREILDEWMAKR